MATNSRGDPPRVGVELFRIPKSSTVHVRFLSPEYFGVLTHYDSQGSVLCSGDACRRCNNSKRIWKGYTASEWFRQADGYWLPCVFEITEALELEIRGTYARGQVWLMARGPQTKKKGSPPVTGRLVDAKPKIEPRSEFSIFPVLERIYHSAEFGASIANPLPPKLQLEAANGYYPPGHEPKQQESPEERDKILRMLREEREGRQPQREGD